MLVVVVVVADYIYKNPSPFLRFKTISVFVCPPPAVFYYLLININYISPYIWFYYIFSDHIYILWSSKLFVGQAGL